MADVFKPVVGRGERVRVLVSLTLDQKKAVDNLAAEHRLSVSGFCQQAIAFALKSMGALSALPKGQEHEG